MRQDFVANVSHELRTPLTTLRGYAETLLEGGLDDAEHREGFVRAMRDGAVRLQALVEDLLALAELERPGRRRAREPLDLRALAAGAVEHVRGAAEPAGLALDARAGAAAHGDGRSRAAGAGAGEPARQRGQVHRARLGASWRSARTASARGARCATPGPASPRATCRASSSASTAWTRRERAARAGRRRPHRHRARTVYRQARLALYWAAEVSVVSRVGDGITFRFEVPLEAKRPGARSQPRSRLPKSIHGTETPPIPPRGRPRAGTCAP